MIRRFCALLDERGVKTDVLTTTGPNDATRLAAEAARNGAHEIIVAGGDGTINEALQGLVGHNVRLAVWPRGTANVLGRELKLPRRLDRLADLIAAGNALRVHPGVAVNEATGDRRYFVLMAGVGLDAAIVDRTRPGLKKRVGKVAFWYAGLEELARWKPIEFTVEVGGEKRRATFCAIGKAPRYGGDLSITPRARLDHPEFEVCLIDAQERRRYLKLLPFAMFGGPPATLKGICYVNATEARATGDGVMVQADGELIGRLPMSFTIAPHTIDIVAGPQNKSASH